MQISGLLFVYINYFIYLCYMNNQTFFTMNFSEFDIELLDAYERHVYNDRLKNGFTRDEALLFIIDSTDGDYSQLSDGLREFVETYEVEP